MVERPVSFRDQGVDNWPSSPCATITNIILTTNTTTTITTADQTTTQDGIADHTTTDHDVRFSALPRLPYPAVIVVIDGNIPSCSARKSCRPSTRPTVVPGELPSQHRGRRYFVTREEGAMTTATTMTTKSGDSSREATSFFYAVGWGEDRGKGRRGGRREERETCQPSLVLTAAHVVFLPFHVCDHDENFQHSPPSLPPVMTGACFYLRRDILVGC